MQFDPTTLYVDWGILREKIISIKILTNLLLYQRYSIPLTLIKVPLPCVIYIDTFKYSNKIPA